MLEIRLLGRFELQKDGQPIDLPSRPAQSLLAYLVLASGVQHRREKLAGMLWPDSDESNARNNLRHALWRLRKSIGEEHILADKVVLAFDPESPYWLDVAALESDPGEQSTDDLLQTLTEYEGELLPGFYEDWVLLERERLQAVFEDRMQVLLDRLGQEGRWREVLEVGEGWISLGGQPEPAYRGLMLAHSRLGDLSSVAAVYRRAVKAFEEELGVEPSEETQALYQELTRSDRTAEVQRTAEALVETAEEFDWRRIKGPRPAFLDAEDGAEPPIQKLFVGRDARLRRLNGFLERALEGRGQVAFVIGESGQGKTSLLREFARRAQAQHSDLVVLMGSSNVHTGSADPYLPFRDIFGMLTGDLESQWASGLLNRDQALRLWSLLPEAAEALFDHGPDLIDLFVPARALAGRLALYEEAAEPLLKRLSRLAARSEELKSDLGIHPHRIFEEVTEVLEQLSADRPIAIFLDDLHWIDAPSASLLFHLGRRILHRRILIVGAYRPEDVAHSAREAPHPLQAVLTEFKRQFGNIWVDLDEPDPTGGRKFVDALLDAAPNRLGGSFRDQLTKITGGQPLFTLELVRDMQAHGDITTDDQGQWVEVGQVKWNRFPPRVEAIIEKRLRRLDPELRRVLDVASVEGETFTAEVVARVLEMEDHELVGTLRKGLEPEHGLVTELGILQPNSHRISQYRFRHNLFQRYLYGLLHERQRVFFHQAVGAALEELYGDRSEDIALQIARHYLESETPHKAVRYLHQAGRRALEVSANEEAVGHLRRALELVAQHRAGPAKARGRRGAEALPYLEQVRLERRLGEAYYGLGNLDRSRAHLEHALKRLGKRLPRGTLRLALALLSQLLVQLGHRLFSPLVVGKSNLPWPRLREAAYIHKFLAEIYLSGNENLRTVYSALRGLNLAEGAGPSPELARAYGDMTVAAPVLRLHFLSETYRSLALQTAKAVDQPPVLAYVLSATSAYTAGEGRWDESIEGLHRSNEIYKASGNWNRLGIGLMLLANCHNLRGEYELARDLYHEVSRLAERSGSVLQKAWALDGQAEAYLRLGNPGEAVRLLEECQVIVEEGSFQQEDVVNNAMLGVAYLRLGQEERARRAAEYAAQLTHRSTPSFFTMFLGYAGVPEVALGLLERDHPASERAELLGFAFRACKELGRFAAVYPIGRPRAQILQGVYARQTGRPGKARQRFEAGLASARRLGMPFDEALAHYELGRLLEAGDDRADHLKRAADLFQSLGTIHHSRLVSNLLDRPLASAQT